jgi:hypothetical protein
MPEASIHVDGYPQTCKHYVCAPSAFWNWGTIHAVAKAVSVQDPSQGKLGSRVSSPLELHASPHRRCAGERRLSSLCPWLPARGRGPPVRDRTNGVHGIGLPPRSSARAPITELLGPGRHDTFVPKRMRIKNLVTPRHATWASPATQPKRRSRCPRSSGSSQKKRTSRSPSRSAKWPPTGRAPCVSAGNCSASSRCWPRAGLWRGGPPHPAGDRRVHATVSRKRPGRALLGWASPGSRVASFVLTWNGAAVQGGGRVLRPERGMSGMYPRWNATT